MAIQCKAPNTLPIRDQGDQGSTSVVAVQIGHVAQVRVAVRVMQTTRRTKRHNSTNHEVKVNNNAVKVVAHNTALTNTVRVAHNSAKTTTKVHHNNNYQWTNKVKVVQ